jgi:hypothetical protein
MTNWAITRREPIRAAGSATDRYLLRMPSPVTLAGSQSRLFASGPQAGRRSCDQNRQWRNRFRVWSKSPLPQR